jgi:hypothetical protein
MEALIRNRGHTETTCLILEENKVLLMINSQQTVLRKTFLDFIFEGVFSKEQFG